MVRNGRLAAEFPHGSDRRTMRGLNLGNRSMTRGRCRVLFLPWRDDLATTRRVEATRLQS
jgi:hypothetical protein